MSELDVTERRKLTPKVRLEEKGIIPNVKDRIGGNYEIERGINGVEF